MDAATFLRFPTDSGVSSRASSVSDAGVGGLAPAEKGGMEGDDAARRRETEGVPSELGR